MAGAGEDEEGVGPVRGVIMPGPVLPHAPALVPLLAVRPKPLEPEIASPLVELAAGERGARRRDRLKLTLGDVEDLGVVQPVCRPFSAATAFVI